MLEIAARRPTSIHQAPEQSCGFLLWRDGGEPGKRAHGA
jgi:hypothetical protein